MLIMLKTWKTEKTEVILNYYNGLGIRGHIVDCDAYGVVFEDENYEKVYCIPYGAVKSIHPAT